MNSVAAFFGYVLTGTVATAALLGMAAFLGRTWITTRLRESVRLETETELERLRAELAAASSRTQAATQAALRSAARMSEASVEARVRSVQELWTCAVELRKLSVVAQLSLAFTDDYVRQHAGQRQLVDAVNKLLDGAKYMEVLNRTNAAEHACPFVSPRAWAVYSGIRGIQVAFVSRMFLLTLPNRQSAIDGWMRTLPSSPIQQVAPEFLGEFQRNPLVTLPRIMAKLETQLIDELRNVLSGASDGPGAAADAVNVTLETERLLAEINRERESEAQNRFPQ